MAAAYGSFLVAETVFHVSGVMGSLAAGLILARAMQRPYEGREQKACPVDEKLEFLWGTLSYLANGSVFLLMGVTITIAMFAERWLAMLIAILAVLIARAAVVYGGLGVVNRVVPNRIPMAYQTVMVWGGLRGAVTLALALSLPVELEYWWTIQSMAFGVVLFTLMVQAPTMQGLLRRNNLSAG